MKNCIVRGLRRRRGITSAILLLAFHLFAVCTAMAREHHLILDAPVTARTLGEPLALADPPPVLAQAARLREVSLHQAVHEPGHIALGDTLILDLFTDTTVTALVERVAFNVNRTYSIRGRVKGRGGHVIFSSTDGRTLATLTEPGNPKIRMIQQFPGQPHHLLMETAMSELGIIEECPCPHAHSLLAPALAAGESTILGDPNAVAEIDVMIVYSPAARAWADNSGGGIHNVIAQSMERAELAMENSDTFVTFRLVHSAEVDYTASGNAVTDLQRLTNTSDGYMEEVHDWRDQYGADLVALFENEPNTGGIAWLLNSPGGNPNFGFSLTRVQQAAFTYTHVHEMGHNMGCGHHSAQNFQAGPGLYDYSAGWRWTGNNGQRYCSVMSYQQGSYFADGLTHTRVAHFSNPDIEHRGAATGTADDDNARTIRNTRHAVAAYRPTAAPPRFALTTALLPAGAGQVQVNPLPDADGTYAPGEEVTLTAVPGTGYEFLAWHGDVADCPGTPLLVVVMDQDREVWARFEGDPDLTLQITDPVPMATVPFATTYISLSGLAGPSAAGSLAWTHLATMEEGSGEASTSWSLPSIPIVVGTNTISVTATNAPAATIRGWDSATNAVYDSGWSHGQNGGDGYGPWAQTTFGQNAGHFVADGSNPRQRLSPRAWGMWANSGDTAKAERALDEPLLIGDSLAVGFQNNWIGSGRSVGVSLRNGADEYLVEFLFIGGGAQYLVNDSLADRSTGVDWTDQPLWLTFTRTGCDTYELDIDGQVLFSGSFAPRSNLDVTRVHFWNFSAGSGPNYDFFFDALETTAGPGPVRTVSDSIDIVREPESTSPFVDTNNNGVPDDWELFYFGSLDVVTEDSDFDGDGQTDVEEYIAGTDPTDPESFFWIHDMDIVPGFPSVFVLRWNSVSNRLYQVERVLDVASDYEPVSDVLPATPPVNVFMEPAPDSDIFYYRVRVWIAP